MQCGRVYRRFRSLILGGSKRARWDSEWSLRVQFDDDLQTPWLAEEPTEFQATFTSLGIPLRNGPEDKPLLTITIGGRIYECLVDTGSTSSLITKPPFKGSVVPGERDIIIRVGGKIIPIEFINGDYWLLRVEVSPFSLDHCLTICPQSPLSLMGRDLLCKLRVTIKCIPGGLTLDILAKQAHLVLTHLATEKDQLHPDLGSATLTVGGGGTPLRWVLKVATPVKIQTKTGPPPCLPQYRIQAEAIEPVRKLMKVYLE